MDFLKGNLQAKVRVTGPAWNPFRDNKWDASRAKKRIEHIKTCLTKKGIPEDRIQVESVGAKQSIDGKGSTLFDLFNGRVYRYLRVECVVIIPALKEIEIKEEK